MKDTHEDSATQHEVVGPERVITCRSLTFSSPEPISEIENVADQGLAVPCDVTSVGQVPNGPNQSAIINLDSTPSVLVYTDTIEEGHPRDLMIPGQVSSECILPACPKFSKSAELVSFTLFPSSDSQPIRESSENAKDQKILCINPRPIWQGLSGDWAAFSSETTSNLRAVSDDPPRLRQSIINSVTLRCTDTTFHQVFLTSIARRSKDRDNVLARDPIDGQLVHVKTRNGLLPARGLNNRWGSMWRIQLQVGEFEKGDSGSPVIDLRSGTLIGILTQSVLPLDIGYILPAVDMEKDAHETCRMLYNENSQLPSIDVPQAFSDLPSNTREVALLPEGHQILPQGSYILSNFMRDGSDRAFQAIFDTWAKQHFENNSTWLTTLMLLLREGIEHNRPGRISYLLDNSTLDVNALDACGKTVIHHAASLGRYKICELLFAREACIQTQDAGGSTPLLIAIKNSHTDIANFLIEKDHERSTLSRPDAKGQTPLDMAAFRNLDSVIDCLVRQKDIPLDSEQYRHALRNIVVGNDSYVQAQWDNLERCAHSSKDESSDASQIKLQCFAALCGSPTAKDLTRPEVMYDALRAAAESGETLCFSFLLGRIGTQINNRHHQVLNDCLVHACKSHSSSMVKLLLENSTDPMHNFQGASALRAAIESGRCDNISLLLDRMVVMSKTVDRRTALNWAARKGHAEAVTLLGQHKACSNCLGTIYREFPLHSAASSGCPDAVHEVIKILDQGDVDREDYLGRTPLMLAAENGHVEVMDSLRQIGANLDHIGGLGRTAVELAAVRGRASTVNWLLSNGSGHVNDKIFCAAARSTDCSPNTIDILLRYGKPQDPFAVIQSGLQQDADTLSRLLSLEPTHYHGLHPAIARQILPRLKYEAFKDFVRPQEACDVCRKGTENEKTLFVAALKNIQDPVDILKWLRSVFQDFCCSDDSLICAASANALYGFELVNFILQDFQNTNVSPKTLEIAAGNARWGSEIFTALFHHHSSPPISITNRLIREIEGNYMQRADASKLLAKTDKVSFGLLQVLGAVRIFDFECVKSLLNRRLDSDSMTLFSEVFVGHPPRLQALFEAAIDSRFDEHFAEEDGETTFSIVSLLLDLTSQANIQVTLSMHMAELLANKASNRREYSFRLMKQVLTANCVALPIAKHILQSIYAAISKGFDYEFLRLASEKSGYCLGPSASLLAAATTNMYSAKGIVQKLLEIWQSELANIDISKRVVTEDVICGAARNRESRRLIELLAPYVLGEVLTPSFWDAVCSNVTEVVPITKILLERMSGSCVESGIEHVVYNHWSIGEQILTDPTRKFFSEHSSSRELALLAARHMKASTLSDILDRSPRIAPVDKLLEAACDNVEKGVDVARVLLDRWPTNLYECQVPKMVMLAAVQNWMCADKLLKTFQEYGMKFTVTEKVLIAAVQNPISCIEVAKLLLDNEERSDLITPQILGQAAANISRPLKLLKILLPEPCEHLLTESVLEAAAGNGAVSIELLMYLCSRTSVHTITPGVILAAAKNSQSGRMGLALPTHVMFCSQTIAGIPAYKNRNRLIRPSTPQLGPSCSFWFEAGSALSDKSPTDLTLLYRDFRGSKQYPMKVRLQRRWAWKNGFSFLRYLLTQAPNVDVRKVIDLAAEFTTCKMMGLLLEHTNHLTPETLMSSVKNVSHGVELTEMLLLQHPHLKVSPESFLVAVRNTPQGSDVLEILCNYIELPSLVAKVAVVKLPIDERRYEIISPRFDGVSQEMLNLSACNEQNGYDLWTGLIKTSPDSVDDSFVEVAVKNRVHACSILDPILYCGAYSTVSSAVLVAAAANQVFAPQLLARLLQLPRQKISESMPELLASAAGNQGTGPETMMCLLEAFGDDCEAHIDFSVLQAAAKNRLHGTKVVATLLTLLRRRTGRLNENFGRLLHAAAANDCQGHTIMKQLMQEVSAEDVGQCDDAVFNAAAKNVAFGKSLMVLLIEFFEITAFSISTWKEACKNESEGPGLIELMLQSAFDPTIFGKDLFLAAAANRRSGCEILSILLSKSSSLIFTEFLTTINQVCAESSMTDEIIAMISKTRRKIPSLLLSVSTVAQLEADTLEQLSTKCGLLIIGVVGSQKGIFSKSNSNCSPVGNAVQRAILTDPKVQLAGPVAENLGRSCNAEVFTLLGDRYNIVDLFPDVSQNQIYGGQIFKRNISNKSLFDSPHSLSYAIRQKDWTLLETLVSNSSQSTILDSIVWKRIDKEVLRFLLKKAENFEVTEEVLIAASPNAACLELLLERRRDGKPAITECIMLEAIKETTTPDSMLLLTEPSHEIVITEKLLTEAIKKVKALGLEVIERLVRSMLSINLSCSVVTAAAAEKGVLESLIQKFGRVPVCDSAVKKAAPYPECLKLLWDCGQKGCLMSEITAPTIVAHNDSRTTLEVTADGQSPMPITENLLEASMGDIEHLSNLLQRYESNICSVTLLSKAAVHGADAFNAIRKRFGSPDLSPQIIRSEWERLDYNVFKSVLGTSPPESLVHAILESLQSPCDLVLQSPSSKVDLLLSHARFSMPARILPLTLLYPPSTFQTVIDTHKDKFKAHTLEKALTVFSNLSDLDKFLVRHLPTNENFSQNFIGLIQSHKQLVTEDLLVQSLMWKGTPFEVVRTIFRLYSPPLERLDFLIEVAGHAQNHSQAALHLLLRIVKALVPQADQEELTCKIERIQNLLIGDWKVEFIQPEKLFVLAKEIVDDVKTSKPKDETRLTVQEVHEGINDDVPSDTDRVYIPRSYWDSSESDNETSEES